MRGRERMVDEGAGALSELELLSVLVGSGTRHHPAHVIAARLLEGGIAQLRRARLVDLLATPGVGEAQACRLMAAIELGRRVAQSRGAVRPRLLRADLLAASLWSRLAHLPHEEFWVVLLTARLEELRSVRVASGGLTQCSVLPREAFAPAILHGAPAVAFIHNHPSGDPRPSADDQRLELLLDEAGRALGVRVVDHLVVSEQGVHSAREGLAAPPPLDAARQDEDRIVPEQQLG